MSKKRSGAGRLVVLIGTTKQTDAAITWYRSFGAMMHGNPFALDHLPNPGELERQIEISSRSGRPLAIRIGNDLLADTDDADRRWSDLRELINLRELIDQLGVLVVAIVATDNDRRTRSDVLSAISSVLVEAADAVLSVVTADALLSVATKEYAVDVIKDRAGVFPSAFRFRG